MSRTSFATVAVFAVMAGSAGAQVSKTIQGEMKVETATVEAIESSNREVTVKKQDGSYDVLYIPANVKRFETLKIGDKITARYYENLFVQLKAPGDKNINRSTGGVVRSDVAPAGTVSHQRTITATIVAIDQSKPTISFSGPNGWKYSTRVEDKAALAKVKVGDKVDITWTEALVVSID